MAAMATPWKHPNSGIYYLRLEVPVSLCSGAVNLAT